MACSLVLLGVSVTAIFADQAVTMDFPLITTPPNLQGLSAAPVELRGSTQRIEIPFQPAQDIIGIFATIVFSEQGHDTIAVSWLPQGKDTPMPLAANLCEGISGLSQKTLQIPEELTWEAGKLIIETNTPLPLVKRVKISWAPPADIYVTDRLHPITYVDAVDHALTKEDLASDQELTPPDGWVDGILTAYLQEDTTSLDGNVEFVVPMPRTPVMAVLDLELLGLTDSTTPVVWVNGVRANHISLEVPDLRDPGYLMTADGLVYAGWRKGGLVLDRSLFKPGDNSLILENKHSGLFVKHAALQLRFEAPPAVTVTSTEPIVVDGGLEIPEAPALTGPSIITGP